MPNINSDQYTHLKYQHTSGYTIARGLDNLPFIRHSQYGLVADCQSVQAAMAILTEFNL